MATWTNKTKNTSTFQKIYAAIVALWGQSTAIWSSTDHSWGGAIFPPTNRSKNTSTFTNKTKN